MMRRGFTLVEILVTVTIGVVIMAAALMIFNFGNRSRNVTATARALQTALLVQERFNEDLSRLIPGSSTIRFHDKPDRVSFWAYDPEFTAGGAIGVRGVVYFRDEVTGLIKREWNDRVDTVGVAPLRSIEFYPFMSPTGPLIRVNMQVGREPGEPPGPDTFHTFLARIPMPRSHPSLKWKPVSGFKTAKEDEPKGVSLPMAEADKKK